ncbi:MAG TPA: glycosyltransferase family 4 protein [Acidimicrobiales bacterium]|nr:glycosyltransferase family 4 protein [Acidimicrobiales bacterium]
MSVTTLTRRRPSGPRVLMVVRLFHPWVGGTERQAQKLARALADDGTDVQVVTGRWFRGTRRHEVIDGIPVTRNHTLWEFFGIKGLRKLGGYLYIVTLVWHLWRRRRTYDVIHVHGLNYHTFGATLAASLLDKPILTKLANSGAASDIDKMRHDRQLKFARLMLRRALSGDRFVALSGAIVDELRAAGVDRHRIVEIPNGVQVSAATRPGYQIVAPARVVFVGRLHPQKGLDTLLTAVQMLLARDPNSIRVHLVGDGPARADLEALVARLAISPHVEFVGSTDDVDAYLDLADVFVLPSRAEGLSNALLEAMAKGLPVVASRIPGNAEVVDSGRDGVLFDVDDPADLAATLQTLIGDQALRERLGRAARRHVVEHFSFAEVARRYRNLYAELCSGDGVIRRDSEMSESQAQEAAR